MSNDRYLDEFVEAKDFYGNPIMCRKHDGYIDNEKIMENKDVELGKIAYIFDYYENKKEWSQLEKLTEEMEELQEEIEETYRLGSLTKNMLSELVDVFIMVSQNLLRFEEKEVVEMINYKLNRQIRRVEDDNRATY